MKERGILFNALMIRAIQDDRKSQTRRVATIQPKPEYATEGWYADRYNNTRNWNLWGKRGTKSANVCGPDMGKCPYGEPGDRLWIREAFARPMQRAGSSDPEYLYRADLAPGETYGGVSKWTPGIHMPRTASRMVLEVLDVRLHPIATMSEEDAIAEGLAKLSKDDGQTWKYGIPDQEGTPGEGVTSWQYWHQSPRVAFHRLWDEINGARGHAWTTNPWVWAITFKRVEDETNTVHLNAFKWKAVGDGRSIHAIDRKPAGGA